MTRTYRRKSKRCSLSSQLVKTAVNEVIVYQKSVNSVAQDLNIPKTSLLRYVRKQKSESHEKFEIQVGYSKHRQIFSDAQESKLVEYITESANIYFGLTPVEVRKLAYECAISFNVDVPESWRNNKQAGPDWFSSFLKRHSSLSIRVPEATSLARATSFNRENVKQFYSKLASVIDRHKLTGAQIYNVDETGITTVQKPRSIVAPKGVKQVGALTSGERGALVTMCLSVNAIGNVIPPMLVFPRINYRDYFLRDGPPCSIGVANKSGWMVAEHFLEYMKHFVKHVRPSKENPVLLLLDNHDSHLAIDILDFAKENGVILLSFPPHCSHKLQPLDRSVYGPLKKAVSTEQDNWMRNHPGQTMTIYDLPSVVREALPRVATTQNVVKGFAVTGISPFNPNIFSDIDYAPSYVTDRPFVTPGTDENPEHNASDSVFEQTDTQTNTNVDTSTRVDGWELITNHLQSKQMTTENVTGDGHCLLYAVIRSSEAQGIKTLTVEKLCERLLDEVQNNLPYYESFGTNRQDILTDMNRYVTEKQYNNDTCDLIMAALCNALAITTVVTQAGGTTVIEVTQSPRRPGLNVDAPPTVNVALHGDHYRAVVPLDDNQMPSEPTTDDPRLPDDSGPLPADEGSQSSSTQSTSTQSTSTQSTSTQSSSTQSSSTQSSSTQSTSTQSTSTQSSSTQSTSTQSTSTQSTSTQSSSTTFQGVPETVLHFTPHTVRPFPKAGERKSAKPNRRKRRTAILTDTPEKEALEREHKDKQAKRAKPKQSRPTRLNFRKQTSKYKNRSTDRQEYFCLVCAEPFSNSKLGEQWIQCQGCKGWSHLDCVSAGRSYICHICDADGSDFIH